MTKGIIFLPGVMGSALFDGGTKVWPSEELDNANSQSADRFKNPSFPLEPIELIQDADTQRVFGAIAITSYTNTAKFFKENGFAILEKKAGWIPPPGSPTDKLFYGFPYDWRLDLRDTADLLHRFIQTIVITSDSSIELYLVGVGMGGLLSRTYLKKHASSTPNIKKQILLGTPNHGQMSAYLALKLGRGLFNDIISQYYPKFRNVPRNLPLLALRLPGIYQLLPDKQYSTYFDDFGPLVSVDDIPEKSIQGTYIAGHSTSSIYPSRKDKAERYALKNDTLVEDALNFHDFLGMDTYLHDRTYAIYSTDLTGVNGIDYNMSMKGMLGSYRSRRNSDGIVTERSIYDLDGLINDRTKEPRPKFTRRFSGIHHAQIHWKHLVLRCVLRLIL